MDTSRLLWCQRDEVNITNSRSLKWYDTKESLCYCIFVVLRKKSGFAEIQSFPNTSSLYDCPTTTTSTKSLQSCPTLCDPTDSSPPGSPAPGILQARTMEWVAFPSPMRESEKWKWSHSVVSDSLWPHELQPTRLLCPWDFPGESTGVGCHCLLRWLP